MKRNANTSSICYKFDWIMSNRFPQGFLTERDIKIILAVFVPPVAVFMHLGLGWHFLLNLFLTLSGYVLGLIHAIWVVNKR